MSSNSISISSRPPQYMDPTGAKSMRGLLNVVEERRAEATGDTKAKEYKVISAADSSPLGNRDSFAWRLADIPRAVNNFRM